MEAGRGSPDSQVDPWCCQENAAFRGLAGGLDCRLLDSIHENTMTGPATLSNDHLTFGCDFDLNRRPPVGVVAGPLGMQSWLYPTHNAWLSISPSLLFRLTRSGHDGPLIVTCPAGRFRVSRINGAGFGEFWVHAVREPLPVGA